MPKKQVKKPSFKFIYINRGITLIQLTGYQLTGFSTIQALTERYFQTDHDIIYTKKI